MTSRVMSGATARGRMGLLKRHNVSQRATDLVCQGPTPE